MKLSKLLLLSLGFSLLTGVSSVKAQTAYSVNGEVLAILGDLSTVYNTAFGATAQYEYTLNEKLTLFGRGGFLYVPNNLELSVLVYLIPIQGGVKYKLTDKLFAQGMVGAHVINAAIIGFGSGSSTQFGLGLGVGTQLGRIEVAPHLQLLGNGWTHAGLRVGLRFEQ
jgi:opacity protein-like surface antigen